MSVNVFNFSLCAALYSAYNVKGVRWIPQSICPVGAIELREKKKTSAMQSMRRSQLGIPNCGVLGQLVTSEVSCDPQNRYWRRKYFEHYQDDQSG